jgi:hypothetical protein
MKRTSIFLIIVCLNFPGKTDDLQDCSFFSLYSGKFLLIPLDSVQIDKTSEFSGEFSDSFFCHAANKLLLHSLSQRLTPVSNENTGISSLRDKALSNDKADMDSLPDLIREIARKSGSDFVVIPNYCSLQQKITTQKGWRDSRGGPSYERPIKNTAIAEIHLKVWDKDGKMICERKGTGKNNKPMFYSFFKKRVKPTEVIKYSRKPFANPLIRALNKAAKDLTVN